VGVEAPYLREYLREHATHLVARPRRRSGTARAMLRVRPLPATGDGLAWGRGCTPRPVRPTDREGSTPDGIFPDAITSGAHENRVARRSGCFRSSRRLRSRQSPYRQSRGRRGALLGSIYPRGQTSWLRPGSSTGRLSALSKVR
jgi:hypothetical protein